MCPAVGLTPRELVWRKNKAQLFRYLRQTPPTHRTPVFLVLPLINRAYILDLRPGASFVEHLLERGFEVFLLDWGIAGDEDQNLDVTAIEGDSYRMRESEQETAARRRRR